MTSNLRHLWSLLIIADENCSQLLLGQISKIGQNPKLAPLAANVQLNNHSGNAAWIDFAISQKGHFLNSTK